MFGLFFDIAMFICLLIALSMTGLLLLAAFDELPTVGWLLTVLCVALHIALKDDVYLIAAGLFAIAGAIGGHGSSITEYMRHRNEDEEGER